MVLFHPLSTVDDDSVFISELKSTFDLTVAWVPEDCPIRRSPTLKSLEVETFRSSILLFQLFTLPSLLPETTFSPSKKSFFLSLISNWGKAFWLMILPAELIES